MSTAGPDAKPPVRRSTARRPRTASDPPAEVHDGAGLVVRGLSAWFGTHRAVADVDLTVAAHSITALIGPSGCGKSTMLRCINRMHELIPGARVEGEILFEGVNVYDPQVDPMVVRHAIGMVFQRPNPFPTKSIYDNVASGLRLTVAHIRRRELDDAVELALQRVALWDEVSQRLQAPATGLSGGQQQRLCLARAIATQPKLLLMDEPCAALDPIATLRIEELITELKKLYTVVIVTHNMQQATRVSDHTAFFNLREVGGPGRMVETGTTRQIFEVPRERETEAYVTGRMG